MKGHAQPTFQPTLIPGSKAAIYIRVQPYGHGSSHPQSHIPAKAFKRGLEVIPLRNIKKRLEDCSHPGKQPSNKKSFGIFLHFDGT